MKRTVLILMAASAISVSAVTSVAGASSSAQKIQLRSTDLGKILVDRAGDTLYMFTHDKRNKDTCVKISGCPGVWPLLKTKGKPIAGKGIKSKLLSTITLAHGVKQVTYAGHPMYLYFVSMPGDTTYVGTNLYGGNWDALNAAGKAVK